MFWDECISIDSNVMKSFNLPRVQTGVGRDVSPLRQRSKWVADDVRALIGAVELSATGNPDVNSLRAFSDDDEKVYAALFEQLSLAGLSVSMARASEIMTLIASEMGVEDFCASDRFLYGFMERTGAKLGSRKPSAIDPLRADQADPRPSTRPRKRPPSWPPRTRLGTLRLKYSSSTTSESRPTMALTSQAQTLRTAKTTKRCYKWTLRRKEERPPRCSPPRSSPPRSSPPRNPPPAKNPPAKKPAEGDENDTAPKSSRVGRISRPARRYSNEQ